jgi:hypothetical protein
MAGFVSSDFVISLYGNVGITLLFYYNFGSLIGGLGYQLAKHKGWLEQGRPLFRKSDGNTDKSMILLAVASLLVGSSILPLLNVNFHLAHLAKLNIGITQTVHAL